MWTPKPRSPRFLLTVFYDDRSGSPLKTAFPLWSFQTLKIEEVRFFWKQNI